MSCCEAISRYQARCGADVRRLAPTVAMVAALLALLSGTAWAGERPELHSVTHIGPQSDHMLLVQGAFTKKPSVRVGGRRARVKEWDTGSLTVKVSRRVKSGFFAVEAETGAGSAYPPLAVQYAGTPGSLKRLKFRKKRDRPQRFLKPVISVDDPGPGLLSVVFSRRESYQYKVKSCTSFNFCIFGECSDRCRTWQSYGSRFWFVGLYVPIEALEPGSQHVCTIADDGALIGYSDPRNVYSTSRGDDVGWWIVIGRDQNGMISGQYCGVVANSKGRKFRVSGTFAAPPDA